MSRNISAKTGGILLIVASLLGVIAMTVFSPSFSSRVSNSKPSSAATAAAPGVQAAPSVESSRAPARERARDSASMFVVATAEPMVERIESPFSSEGTDSVAKLCAAHVRQERSSHDADTNGVEIGERYGVHSIPGRGRDSLIVEGTVPSPDGTPAVWHCAATTTVDSRRGIMRLVIEDGWPGVSSRFRTAHPINVVGEDLCLQRTKVLFPESDFRSLKRWRVADTLHVTGETMPLDAGAVSGDFHCRALVREGAILSVVSVAGRD